MSINESKLVEKKHLTEGKDRYISGKGKDTGGYPYRKPRFTGECENLKECVFDYEGDKQGGVFEANLKKLSIYAGATFDTGSEIMTMIDGLTPVSIKKPELYTGSDPMDLKIQELEIGQYVKTKARFEMEVKKLYAVIIGQCTEMMMTKLKAMPTFNDIHNNKNTLELLKAIKGLAFKFDGEKELGMSLVEAMDKFYRFYQSKEMPNAQYLEKFNNIVDVIEHYGGTVAVHRKMTENYLALLTGGVYDPINWRNVYSDEQIAEATEKGKENILAKMFLVRADKGRYGGMLAKLQNDYITGRVNVYPVDRIAAFSLLNNWNNGYERGAYVFGGAHSGTSFAQDGAKRNNTIACWGCGKEGVVLAQCVNDECIKKFKEKQAKKSGIVNKSMNQGVQHFNSAFQTTNEASIDNDDDFEIDEYAGYDIGHDFHQSIDEQTINPRHNCKKVGDTMILLDSQSTHSTFYVRRLVNNIRDAPRPLVMSTNGGEIVYRQLADLPNFGTVWFNENAIANIISMSEAERKGHSISYSPGCLTLTNPKNGHHTEFRITPSGLYAYKNPIGGTSMVQTVQENEQLFTPRQVVMAQKAKELYEMIGRPSYNDYMAIVKNNLQLNAKITPRDILQYSEKI
jgi:hypothetical protein